MRIFTGWNKNGITGQSRHGAAVFVLALVIWFIAPDIARAATAGPNNPSTGANNSSIGSRSWSNASNVVSSDSQDVSATSLTSSAASNYLVATGFGFSIPSGSTISGIQVSIERSDGGVSSSRYIRDNSVKIVKGGSITGAEHADASTNWPTSDASASYGSSTDLWGTTWTTSDINASNFGVAISAEGTSSSSETAMIDNIRITVTYTAGTGDATAPAAGTVTPSAQSGNYVPGTFDLTTTFTDSESPVTTCYYTTNGSTWTAATLSGTGPDYTCSKTGITGSNGSSMTLNMRATSSGGTRTATSITRTIDSSRPSDGSSLNATSASSSQIDLSWSSASDSGSGLDATNTYKVVRAKGTSTAPADCSGSAFYQGASRSFSNTGLQAGTQYAYRVCAYDKVGNVSTGRTDYATTQSGPPNEVGGTLVVTPNYNGYVDSPLAITEDFYSTSTSGSVTSCQYTLNGSTWSSAAVSGSSPNYTCTASNVNASNGTALTLKMRATNSRGTSTPSATISMTVDSAGPVDGTLTATGPAVGQLGLNWTAATDSGAGLASSNIYKLVRATGSTVPANCTGTAVYAGNALAYTDKSVTIGQQYSYRVCAYDYFGNASTGKTASATPPAVLNSTGAGTCAARMSGTKAIDVTMPYTDDENANNTYTVAYKLSSSGAWINWVTNAAHVVSPFNTRIIGLTPETSYDIRCTYNDPDGVGGVNANPQTITGVFTDTPAKLTHNSVNTKSDKWTDGWGIAGGQYGQFVCETCHMSGDTNNIMRIRGSITVPDASKGNIPGSAVVFESRTTPNGFGDDSNSHAASQKICEVCHTKTAHHRYDTSGQTDGRDHFNNESCGACHQHKKGFNGGDCISCHSLQQGNRNPVAGEFSGNSHHIQGVTLTNAMCYQCHWEAESNGNVNPTYHGGGAKPGAAVNLVIYGAGTRPGTYTAGTTAVEYTANGTRTELQKLNQHCLGCHSDANKTTQPFGDGKTPNYYAWDGACSNSAYDNNKAACTANNGDWTPGTSVAARYSQSGTAPWGKYSSANVTPKNKQNKSYSAHGNAANNTRGWDLNETWPSTGGGVTVLCFDCHNSHGSTVGGSTTSYTSATASGGLLKDTNAGKGGYTVTYKPQAGGSIEDNNEYKEGAALCFDCHLTQNAGTKPWGYQGTFTATQAIQGYSDTLYFGPGVFGYQSRYPYKASLTSKGGHFGASSPMNIAPMSAIGGLCTPCHDPHGVSPVLGTNQAYAVPLLKGTWMTSPYKEDATPSAKNEKRGTIGEDGDRVAYSAASTPGYHIDQNTFDAGTTSTDRNGTIVYSWNINSTARITQTVDQFGGLCLRCHPKSSIAPGTNSTWKSMDRVHNSVKGWGTFGANANNAIHSYTCSKCHAPHNSALDRLLVTNCLDFTHRGRVASGGIAGGPAYGTGEEGRGQGSFPVGGSMRRSTTTKYFFGGGSSSAPSMSSSRVAMTTCHDNTNSSGWPANQRWNIKTQWGTPGTQPSPIDYGKD